MGRRCGTGGSVGPALGLGVVWGQLWGLRALDVVAHLIWAVVHPLAEDSSQRQGHCADYNHL